MLTVEINNKIIYKHMRGKNSAGQKVQKYLHCYRIEMHEGENLLMSFEATGIEMCLKISLRLKHVCEE